MKKYDYSVRDPLTAKIISACYQVHNGLGHGFVERIYLQALKIMLDKLQLSYQEEKEFWVLFDGERIGKFKIDIVVENKVVVELKAVSGNLPKVFESQVVSYLKACKLSVGLLVNFGNRSCEVRRIMISS